MESKYKIKKMKHVQSGAQFGEAELIFGTNREYMAISLDNTYVITIESQYFNYFYQKHEQAHLHRTIRERMNSKLFQHIDNLQLYKIMENTKMIEFEKNQVVFKQGDEV